MAISAQTTPGIVRTVIAGLIASLVIGMWEMVLELFLGNGLWAPVVYIAATVLRSLQQVATPVPFDLVAVILGLIGHMMNSVILAIIFWLIAPRFTSSTSGFIGAGAVYGIIVFAAMWFVVLPAIDPVMLRLNFIVFLIGHIMWGAVLGISMAGETGPEPARAT
jgi:uncharacterized membrane protein YagU involved in acid resistance